MENAVLYQVAILANGEKPLHPLLYSILENNEKLICCDGAIDTLQALKLKPDLIIGDLDSMNTNYLAEYKDIILKDDDPEYSDLNKALRYCWKHEHHRLAIIGGGGLRDDHALNNLSIMLHYAEKGMNIEMITNYGIYTPIFSTHTFLSFPKQQVSVFSFSPDTPLTFSGLKYPVKERCFKELWEGALNEALSEEFEIRFDKGKVLVYRAFDLQ
jgi:thiamine pyrophosphokinase